MTNKDEEVHIDENGIHVSENGKEKVHVGKDGIHIHDEHHDVDIPEKKLHRPASYETVKGMLYSLSVIAAIVTYLVLGFTLPDNQGWANWWPVFIFAPVIPSIYEAIVNRSFCRLLVPLIVVSVYCFIGMNYGMWHPWWILFFIIPVYYIIFGPVDAAIKRARLKKAVGCGCSSCHCHDEDDDDDDDVIDATK